MGLFDGVRKIFGVLPPDSLPYGEGDPRPFKVPDMNLDKYRPRCADGFRHISKRAARNCRGHNKAGGRSFFE